MTWRSISVPAYRGPNGVPQTKGLPCPLNETICAKKRKTLHRSTGHTYTHPHVRRRGQWPRDTIVTAVRKRLIVGWHGKYWIFYCFLLFAGECRYRQTRQGGRVGSMGLTNTVMKAKGHLFEHQAMSWEMTWHTVAFLVGFGVMWCRLWNDDDGIESITPSHRPTNWSDCTRLGVGVCVLV